MNFIKSKKTEKIIKDLLNFLEKSTTNRLIIGGIILMGLFWFGVTFFQYQGFAYITGDTSVAEQAIWNTVHGRIFYQSFLGTETNFREHLNFIQLLYVPLYAVFPHTLTLFLIIQASFVAGAIFLYYFVKKRFASNGIGLVAVLLFIFHPLIASQAVADMHVVAVAGPAFLMLLMAYHEKKYKHFIFWVIFMVFISEFVAPTVFLVGVLAFLERRNWKWFIPPILGGSALYMAAKYYITIGFSSSGNILSKFTPEALKSIYKLNKRLDLVKESLASLLWIFPWISKYSLLLIPSLMIALFIIIPGRIGGGNHVFILIPPILVMIFVDLLDRFSNFRKWIVGIALVGIVLSIYPWYKIMEIDRSDLAEEMQRAVLAVKDGGSLTASTQFGPNLCRREEFFFPFNDKMTDYVVLKKSKVEKSKNELEDQELKYDQKIEQSELYRIVFEEGRTVVFAKKEKIANLLNISIEELEKMDNALLLKEWKKLERNVGWLD